MSRFCESVASDMSRWTPVQTSVKRPSSEKLWAWMALSSVRIAYVAIKRKIKMGYDNAEVINP